jgi:exodeoxyribonuclease VII large subunit
MPDPFPDGARLVAEPVAGDNALAVTVSELSGRLKRVVEGEFGHVRLRGEISGYKRVASGHAYLCLKDEGAVIDGVIWKGQASALPFRPEDGIEVVATGRLTTYPGRSKYQIVIERMELAGAGALMALLEKLKARLAAEGLFDPAAKKLLPFLPRTIGVVTSPTGAVIRDILHRLEDRCPTHVVVWPVKVQGEGAAAEVAAAVRGFDAMAEGERPDLVIVARGGGSIEDLWAFNEESVVRAVAACRIPVISAVGHETDTTLCDHAADRRAPTPTAAAEMAVPVLSELRHTVASHAARTQRCASRYLERGRERLDAIARLLPKRDALLGPQRQRADEAGQRLGLALERRVAGARGVLDRAAGAFRPAVLRRQLDRGRERLATTWRSGVLDPRLERARDRLDGIERLLRSLNPDGVLERGYARVTNRAGATLVSAVAAREAGALSLRFRGGEQIDVTVDGAGSGAAGGPAKVERPASRAYLKSKPDQPTLF